VRVAGRVHGGKGTGWIFQPSPHPHPWRGLVGYPLVTHQVEPGFSKIRSEFESRSTMTNIVDLAFLHSHNVALGSKNAKGDGQG
jgi:hypothetical protein